ncbi:hypothetical protein [Sphaerisporangium dianthi]|uniref:Uncharacterized protein n=1 Tax=Sphaerisporangium dianthi TaxID=1436120 RepID=A0ABV9CF07_9ACTN
MDGFITEIDHARGTIGEHTEAIRRIFTTNGIPATSLAPITEVEHWIDHHLPDLRRRVQIAKNTAKLPDWSPGAGRGLVPYKETNALPAAEAQRLGTDLAAEYKAINPDVLFDPGLDEKYQKIVNVLEANVHDPQFTAAFFAGLGLNRTLRLPELLRRNLQESDQAAVDTVSQALGTAVTAGGAAVAGFAAISNGMKKKASNYDEQRAIGELLSAGRFPTEWLAEVVVTQIFVPGDKSRGKVLAPYLQALAKDPGAARLAISVATSDSPLPKDPFASLAPSLRSHPEDQRPDLAAFLKNLNDRASAHDTSADSFGRLLAAASGVYDEQDGHHSDAAARFAFTVITTASAFNLAEPTRVYLSQMAGSYITEIAEGADLGDANHVLPSAFGAVESQIPGLKPSFQLSPEDTYKFIKTFANNLHNQAPFQAGMDILTTRLIGDAVSDMTITRDSTRLDDTFAVLGNLRGLQLAAREKLGKAIDDAAEEYRNNESMLIGTVFGIAGLGGVLERVPKTWTAISTAWSGYDTYVRSDEKELEKVRTADERETLGRQHAIAQSLISAGLKPEVSPTDYQNAHPNAVPIADDAGNLRPFADILKLGNDGLDSLDRWFLENDMGKDKNSLGETTRFLADRFDGRKDYARDRAHVFDN